MLYIHLNQQANNNWGLKSLYHDSCPLFYQEKYGLIHNDEIFHSLLGIFYITDSQKYTLLTEQITYKMSVNNCFR